MADEAGTIPYDDLDKPVVRLCRAINRLPGVLTLGSCGGHPPAEQTHASADENRWWVMFGVEIAEDGRPTYDGWLSTEFLAWAFRGLATEFAIQATFHSPPPWLNEPGHMLAFQIDGWRDGDGGIEADHIAERIERWTSEFVASG